MHEPSTLPVMVIDDEPHLRITASQTLELAGYTQMRFLAYYGRSWRQAAGHESRYGWRLFHSHLATLNGPGALYCPPKTGESTPCMSRRRCRSW